MIAWWTAKYSPAESSEFNEAPKITASKRTAFLDLGLEHLWVVYSGQHRYPVDEQISVWPLKEIMKLPVAINKG
jgi:hypothetical protein